MNFKKSYSYGKQSISFKDIWEVVKTLRSNWLTQGPKVKEFEQALCDYTGAKYCVVVSNGTAALHLAVLSLGISKGDEVITSPITFLASSNAILYSGGIVKFADIDEKTACIDPIQIEKQIIDKTKAIMPIHFAGQSCDMEKIFNIAKNHNLFVIEDAAHGLGSEYKGCKVGSCKYSDITTFSFHPVKNITTGEGGAITTNNKDIYEKLLMLRAHGITKNKNLLTKNDGPWYYEQHYLGFNYRITDIQCALGISQLKRLDKFIKRRRDIVEVYKTEFENDDRFSLLEEKEYSKAAFHIFPVLINFEKVKIGKKELFENLKKEGLFLQVHYIPVYLQPYYKMFGFKNGDFPNSEEHYKRTISLPLYIELRKNDLKNIVKIIKKIVV
ncbi:UDP-4-amino-4,6-dideoxy-N-acetyl-beta-L-altrosamine transaminase [Candidatus Babeliales bacterium]|nr:UDP-4-amino-4,6-dideoxy-N-acetyl-beta-L-altrosamine transaminase [Candidatus Babeliales bacterium]